MSVPAGLNQENRLLIVDDEPAIVNVLSTLLAPEGFHISGAFSGEAALEQLQESVFDVLITDIRMDGMDGFELIEHTRAIDPYIHVIVITAHDCYDMVRRALSHGAYDYVTKPLNNHDSIISSVKRANLSTRLERDNANLLEQLSASHAMLEDANRRLRELNDELLVQASTDSLTQLYNRRYLDASIENEVARRNRYPDPLSVVMLDIDNFKAFNDQHGHEGGDIALQNVSRLLQSCARNTDAIGRFGGEEFMIILPKTDPVNAMVFAERMRVTIEKTAINLGAVTGSVTASLGVAGVEKDEPDVSAQQLVAAADRALYVAKDEGRNRVKAGVVDFSVLVDVVRRVG